MSSITLLPSTLGQVLTARLTGVGGYTGRAVVTLTSLKNGRQKLYIRLYGVGGLRAEFFANKTLVNSIPIKDGAAQFTMIASRGEIVRGLAGGSRIEIFQNDAPILEGTLITKKSASSVMLREYVRLANKTWSKLKRSGV